MNTKLIATLATADDTFWGKSFFSNDAWTNPLPRLDNRLRITTQ